MVKLYYTIFENDSQSEKYDKLFDLLPIQMKAKALSYRRRCDRLKSLFGKLLLLKALRQLNYCENLLENIKLDVNNRPYFNPELDFNISHSGCCAICILSNEGRVGIDVELIQEINFLDFKNQWKPEEWESIINSVQPLRQFYDFWTRKEAIIKADGGGLIIPLNKIDVRNRKVELEGHEWYLEKVELPEDYIAHVASDHSLTDRIRVEKVQF